MSERASASRRERPGKRARGGRDARGLGGDQVEGRRAVLELLRGERRRCREVFVARDRDPDAMLDEILELAGKRVKLVAAERLDEIAVTTAPQGVVACADPIRDVDLDDLLADPSAFCVALDRVSDPRNLGAVLRVAETAGVTGVLVPRHRAARLTPAAMKAAAGAAEYVPVCAVGGIPAALDRARRRDVWTVGLDEHTETSVFGLALATEPLVVVLGAEGRGLGDLSRARCDQLVAIPMRGALASLNVASAAAIACHEIARIRAETTRER